MNVAHGILNLEFMANPFKFRSTEKVTQVGNLTDVGLLFFIFLYKKETLKRVPLCRLPS